jgi:exosortase E/protease (VPEID-CTERM system)
VNAPASYDSLPDADATFDQTARINWGAFVRVLIAALIVPELIYFSRPIDIAIVDGSRGWWLFLVQHHRTFAAVFSTSAIAAVIFGWESFRRLVGEDLRGPVEDPVTCAAFLAIHLAAVAFLIAWVITIVLNRRLDSAEGPAWFCVGAGLSAVALLSWFVALLPARSWLRWARVNPVAILGAIAVAICARIAGVYALGLWRPLTASTLRTVDLLLRTLGQTTLVDAGAARIGTTHFTVTIAPDCSGLEGIGLMSVFVAGYLWLCRRELRFPASLILLPVGVTSIWFLNVVRITALILIGGWSERVAIDGFHTMAGWLFYTAAVCGIVIVSRRLPTFSVAEPAPRRLAAPNPASAYLAPMLTILLIAMLTRIAGGGFDFLYPFRVIGAGIVLWLYRDRLAEFRRDISWFAVMLGGVVFIVWVVLQPRSNVAAEDHAFATQLAALSVPIASLWIAIRAIGAVVTVPIAEELAFRGYLLRKLVSVDFERVDFRHFTMLSFLLSSALFGILHQQWIAGVIAGMLFAVAMYRRGALFDAIIAHSTANAMLSAYVLASHRWSLWN